MQSLLKQNQIFSSPAQNLPISAPAPGWRCRSSPRRSLPVQAEIEPYPTILNTSRSSHICYYPPTPPTQKKHLQQHPAGLSCKPSQPSWTSASPRLGHLCPQGILLGPAFGTMGHLWGVHICRELADVLWFCCIPQGKLKLFGKTCCAAGEGCTAWDGDVLPPHHQIPGLWYTSDSNRSKMALTRLLAPFVLEGTPLPKLHCCDLLCSAAWDFHCRRSLRRGENDPPLTCVPIIRLAGCFTQREAMILMSQ